MQFFLLVCNMLCYVPIIILCHSSGSERVGKIVAEAAAKFLTPVTLEVCFSSFFDISGLMTFTAARRYHQNASLRIHNHD
jgi:hypothetical protein